MRLSQNEIQKFMLWESQSKIEGSYMLHTMPMLHHTSSHRLTSNLASPDTWQIKLILFDDKCEGNHPAALQQSSRIINAATNKIPPVAKRILTMAGLWHQIFMLARLVIERLSLDIDPLVGDVTAVKCHPVLALPAQCSASGAEQQTAGRDWCCHNVI